MKFENNSNDNSENNSSDDNSDDNSVDRYETSSENKYVRTGRCFLATLLSSTAVSLPHAYVYAYAYVYVSAS